MTKNSLFIKGISFLLCFGLVFCFVSCQREKSESGVASIESLKNETKKQRNERMTWWQEARFGLFIHWGLYAVPAGEWKGETNHAEWILTTAQIPVDEYEKFAPKFNPVKFDASDWVRMAKDAGMKYIVITSKHHDGFSLFDSKITDYDVMDATPFKRDILKELSDECRKQGIKMCWYYSIMDWHHPDYLPRRGWEKRSAEGADFDRYVRYMKNQVKELLTNYGEIGVLWFDGEWEHTWDSERGKELYWNVRSLQPNIIINNRVGKGRAGMAGTYDPETASGDFGTPEQEIPATGLGYDWETCMTMNNHWGYNKNDNNWKSKEDLIRKLVDISSKGGNFLLNVGPTAEGLFPQPSVERLAAIGKWMRANGESIYGTTASLFEKLDWGRSTTKDNKLYLHVFDWPEDGKLRVPGLVSRAKSVYLLDDSKTNLDIDYLHGSAVITLPESAPDEIVSVIVLKFREKPEVVQSPEINSEHDIFIDKLKVSLASNLDNVDVRYTLDGSEPTIESPICRDVITLKDSTMVTCQVWRGGNPISGISKTIFNKVLPREAEKRSDFEPGLRYNYYHGDWRRLPDFNSLKSTASGTIGHFDISNSDRKEYFAFRFTGFITAQRDGVYTFYLASDDGSRLLVGDKIVVNNDGLHGSVEKTGVIALEAGVHPITVEFFQHTGGVDFDVSYAGPGINKQPLHSFLLLH